jgi:hypothetical protein
MSVSLTSAPLHGPPAMPGPATIGFTPTEASYGTDFAQRSVRRFLP